MDLERLMHSKRYATTVWTALVMSAVVVTVASLLGRALLNVKGALNDGKEKTGATLISVLYKHAPGKIIQDIQDLPERNGEPAWLVKLLHESGKMTYTYVRLKWDEKEKEWVLQQMADLRDAAVPTATAGQAEETQ